MNFSAINNVGNKNCDGRTEELVFVAISKVTRPDLCCRFFFIVVSIKDHFMFWLPYLSYFRRFIEADFTSITPEILTKIW